MLNQFINKFRNSNKSLIYIIEKSAVRFIAGALVCGLSALAVAAAPADLDQAFGTNGVSVKAIGDVSYFQDVAVQPDGKIVGVGNSTTGTNKQYLAARFNSDGTLDTTFGGGNGYITLNPGGSDSYVKSVVILPDGKILLVAHNDATKDIEVLRRLPNGDADATFNGGSLTFTIGTGDDVPADAIVQPNGKILIAGACQDGFVNDNPGFPLFKMCFARLNANGSFDNGFVSQNGASGKFIVQSPYNYQSAGIKSMALLPDGKIVAAGFVQSNGSQQTVLLRLGANGALDTNFGSQGFYFPATVYAFQVAEKIVAADGKLLIAGTVSEDTAVVDNSGDSHFFVVRLNGDGTADSSFGSTRYVDFDHRDDKLSDMTVQPDGKIVLAGSSSNNNNPGDFATARLLHNGNPDTTYGNGGKHLHSLPGFERFHAVALQPNGRIVGAGTASLNGAWKTALVRYAGRNTAGDFDGDGRADIAVFRPSSAAWYILRSSDKQMQAAQFGIAADKPVAADYDADGKTDIAVYRGGNWYVLQSSDGAFRHFQHGTTADIPAPMLSNGTGHVNPAVFQPNGVWSVTSNPIFALPNLGTAVFAEMFGQAGDIPVAGFYDNDASPNFAVFRPSNGTWFIRSKSGNSQLQSVQFGLNGDIPQAADFDGDLKTDFAVYRPSNGTWYVLRSSDNQFQAIKFGLNGDIPAARDYDGDERADFAVFRPSNGTWYLLQTTKGFAAEQFGTNGDVPSN